MWTVRILAAHDVAEHRDIIEIEHRNVAQLDDASGIVHVWQLHKTAPGLRERVEVGRYEATSIAHMDVFWVDPS